jgi:hypothetical protein
MSETRRHTHTEPQAKSTDSGNASSILCNLSAQGILFDLKKNKVTEQFMALHDEEYSDSFSSSTAVRNVNLVG